MKINLHHKIMIVFLVVIAVVLSGAYLYLYKGFRSYAYGSVRANLLKQGGFAGAFVERYLTREGLSYDVDEVADSIGKNLGVHVTILGRYGTVVGDSSLDGEALRNAENLSGKPEVRDALLLKRGEARRPGGNSGEEVLYVATGFGSGETQGVIRLAVPFSDITALSDYLKQLLIIAVFAAFVIAISIIFAASHFITKPIKSMSRIARDIMKGDFPAKVALKTRDEVSDLAKAFNHMLVEIKSKMEEIASGKSRIEAMFRGMSEGMTVVDSEGTIAYMNRPLRDFLKLKESPLGTNLSGLTEGAEIEKLIGAASKLKSGIISREISGLFKKKQKHLIHATPVIRHGAADGAVLVFPNIAKRKKTSEKRR